MVVGLLLSIPSHVVPAPVPQGGRTIHHSELIILRKKFLWRDCPELEEYLIANHRADYSHHSALNYTPEQKSFDRNRLTKGLLELAASLNCVFDETCFTLAAVRDKIHCHYNSAGKKKEELGPSV